VPFTNDVRYLGRNLICLDISHGMEGLSIPCTNDIDGAPVPSFDYITYNRYSTYCVMFSQSILLIIYSQ
jgi:hypothetical protein